MTETQSAPKKAFAQKLKEKWGVKNNFQFLLILTVFAITGSSSVKLASYVTDFIGVYKDQTNPWIYYPIRIIAVFPLYQLLLIIVGTVFGQFKFFWAFEKKMLSGFARPFTGKKNVN